MRQNIVLTVFHTQNIHHHVWKTVRTTLQRDVGIQLRGGHEMEKNCGTNLSHSFPCFAFCLGLENNKTSKCGSESFPHMMTYILCVEKCQT